VADRQDSDREVLTSLPRSRPVRRSAKRAARPDPAAAAEPRTKAKASSAGASKTRNGSARAKPAAAAQPKAAARPTPAGKRPARPPRKVPPAGYASARSHAEDDRTSGSADLVGNAVQAAGELAQIGFAVGRQALQSMIDRLPKP
jgi:hypothetical protein